MRAAVFTAALLAAPLAHAAEPVRLEYERAEGAESCPDRETFEAILTSRVGRAAWDESATRVVRVVLAEKRVGAFAGRMELLEGGAVLGVRDVEPRSGGCREVAETLGLAVSLAIDIPLAAESAALLDEIGRASTLADATIWDELAPARAPFSDAREDAPIAAPAPRMPGRPLPLMLFAGTEGAYSFWSGGTEGADEHYQSTVFSGDLAAGGEAPIARGYTLDVLVTGYSASRRDRRDFMDLERYGRRSRDGSLYVRKSVGATAMRTAMRWDGEDAAVSLGVLVGGIRQHGCQHDRVKGWETPLCGDRQQWAAFPTFGARMGPSSGPYVTLGVLDSRSVGGELAHIGVGAILPRDRRVDTSIVAAAEGVGVRVEMEMPVGRELVIMPSISGGILYDTFTDGGRNNWVRAGCAIGIRR